MGNSPQCPELVALLWACESFITSAGGLQVGLGRLEMHGQGSRPRDGQVPEILSDGRELPNAKLTWLGCLRR